MKPIVSNMAPITNCIGPASVDLDEKKLKARQKFEKPLGFEFHQLLLFFVTFGHLITIYFIYPVFTGRIPWGLLLFQFAYAYVGGFGITVGAHRYWTHRTFKAKLPLQVLLMLMQTVAFQNSIYKWALDHRLHHKFMDTDLDPYNSKRGFWYCHMTWLLQPSHPKLVEKRRSFDIPDLEQDPVITFQHRWYHQLIFVMCLALPTGVGYYFWGDVIPFLDLVAANFARWVYNLHATFSVNSFAHMWGMRPYDKHISPVENKLVTLFAAGEGWHNYHHTFPWDYRASEWGWSLNASAMLIDFFAWMGWAYELKTVSPEMIRKRKKRTGNPDSKDEDEEVLPNLDSAIWGWGDEKLSEEARNVTTILNRGQLK